MSINEDKSITIIPQATIQMVTTQTNYTEEEAILHLSTNNNDPIKVIRAFMGLDSVPTNTVTSSKTKSQERYRVIREEIYKDNHTKELQSRN